ncbi:MAG TPA: transporter [Chitinophagales bacterium]|nr:transporter [Chitinophagales bacterium]
MRKLLFVLTVLFLSKNAISQDTAIFHFATTRGSNAEGNLLVPKGKAQVEVGVTYNYYKNYHEIQAPNFLLKYGISNYFEFRINGDATTYKAETYKETGLHPIYLGMKIKMIDAKKYAPGSSFIGGLSVNIISTKNFRTKYVAPYFKIVMEQYLPKNFGMIYNYGLFWNGEDAKPTYNFAVATNYTKVIGKPTSKHQQVKLFLEVFGFYPQGERFDVRGNLGFAYLFNKWLQFDFSAGAGFLKTSPKFICSSGLVFRFLNTKEKTKEKKKK